MEVEFNNIRINAWPVSAIVILISLIIELRKKRNWPYMFCLLAFSIYIVLAIREIFFPIIINGDYVDRMRTISIISHINFIPFYVDQKQIFNERDLTDFAKNIILTLPFGFGIFFVFHIRYKDILWLPLAIGFGIEATQLMISLILRYPYRVIDITDVLLNAIGVWIGYGFFRFFALVFSKTTRDINVSHNGWVEYIHEIVTHS